MESLEIFVGLCLLGYGVCTCKTHSMIQRLLRQTEFKNKNIDIMLIVKNGSVLIGLSFIFSGCCRYCERMFNYQLSSGVMMECFTCIIVLTAFTFGNSINRKGK